MGLGLIPFLKYIVNFDNQIDVNYYSIYILYLFQSAFSYLFYAYKGSILTANQQDYVVSKINYRCSIISAILQGILLYAFRNYYVYLMIPIVIEIIRGLLVAIEVDHRFNYLKEKEVQPLDEKEKNKLGKIFML